MAQTKMLSWNVNGLRAARKKGFDDVMADLDPDIIALQETKMSADYDDILPGYNHYILNATSKKGYSGVAVFTRIEPLNVTHGIGSEKYDPEGRVITLEFDDYYLVNVYTLNAQRGLTRLDERQEWDQLFFDYLAELEKKKPVISCGDFNVAHKEIDLARPKSNKRNAGFTEEERSGFDRYIDNGFIDTFRKFNSEGDNYTWWSYMGGARSRNVGWRIDYFIASKALEDRIINAEILSEIMGSDHCPVTLTLK